MGDNYGFFELKKKVTILNKPMQVGFSILDISKTLMYDFHYNYILKKYGPDKAKLLFTDTDSLCYEIETDDAFQDMVDDKYMFDLSDFSADFKTKQGNNVLSNENKKVPGKFKLETLKTIALEFIGLRSKCYSIKLENDTEKSTCKGVKKCVKNKELLHQKYKDTLFKGQNQSCKQKTIRSFDHQVYSIQTEKIALSAFNDKKYLIDNVSGYSYGHYKISL